MSRFSVSPIGTAGINYEYKWRQKRCRKVNISFPATMSTTVLNDNRLIFVMTALNLKYQQMQVCSENIKTLIVITDHTWEIVIVLKLMTKLLKNCELTCRLPKLSHTVVPLNKKFLLSTDISKEWTWQKIWKLPITMTDRNVWKKNQSFYILNTMRCTAMTFCIHKPHLWPMIRGQTLRR